jgi:hypothetical protein
MKKIGKKKTTTTTTKKVNKNLFLFTEKSIVEIWAIESE